MILSNSLFLCLSVVVKGSMALTEALFEVLTLVFAYIPWKMVDGIQVLEYLLLTGFHCVFLLPLLDGQIFY